MRRSFGGGGRGMGGGSGGGGSMMRTVQRVVRAGVGGAPPEPFSPSSNTTIAASTTANSRKSANFNNKKQPTNTPNTTLTLSSSSSPGGGNSNNNNNNNNNSGSAFSSLISLPAVSAAHGAAAPTTTWAAASCSSVPTTPCGSDEYLDWECVDGRHEDDQRVHVYYNDLVFGTVPSKDEVHHAVTALQQVLRTSSYTRFDAGEDVADEVTNPVAFDKRISSAESNEMDWLEPSLHFCNSRMMQPHGSDRVYDAFHLLQNEPSVQRMVVSLSSDKAVWDAVMDNEVVKELRGSISQVDNKPGESLGKDSDKQVSVKDILSWVVVNAKAKIMEMIENISKLFNGVFETSSEEKKGDAANPMEEKLKASLLLSIVVLLIVVVARAQSA